MTSPLTGEALAKAIAAPFPDAVEAHRDGAVWVRPAVVADVARFLKEAPGMEFDYLDSITAVDYVDHFEMVYHLTSFVHNHSAVVKARVPGRGEPSLPTVVSVWKGADLQEREVWDLMGVRFEGHPNMKRLLLWEGFQGHPLRRDFTG